MAKYKLIKNIANAKSFRFDGVKYEARSITDKQLKNLFKSDCPFVIEEKAKSPKPSKKKSNVEKEETGSATE